MSKGVLIDTSAWIEALRRDGDSETRARVRESLATATAWLCDMVRLELWNGARGRAEREMLAALERDLEVAVIDEPVWESARALARRCRDAGVTVPATDLLVAACAERHDLDLLHRDAHYEQIASLLSQRRDD